MADDTRSPQTRQPRIPWNKGKLTGRDRRSGRPRGEGGKPASHGHAPPRSSGCPTLSPALRQEPRTAAFVVFSPRLHHPWYSRFLRWTQRDRWVPLQSLSLLSDSSVHCLEGVTPLALSAHDVEVALRVTKLTQ
jgi:hypothetical protein